MNFKYNIKQRTRTIQGLRSFKDTLPRNVKKIINKKGDIYSKILDNWKYLVGSELFKVCYPKSYKGSNKLSTSTLIIMVKRGHEVSLEYSNKLITNKINTFFGYDVLEKIKLIKFEDEVQDNKTINKEKNFKNNKFIKKISTIKNEKIKNSLNELTKLFKQR